MRLPLGPPSVLHHCDASRCNVSAVALNIKNVEVERLAAEIAALTGESKTEAIRQALLARRKELTVEERMAHLNHWLETEVWPHIPAEHLGTRLPKAEEEEILGIGPDGY